MAILKYSPEHAKVVATRDALEVELHALRAHINADDGKFVALDPTEQDLLHKQERAMTRLHDILSRRIAAFPVS